MTLFTAHHSIHSFLWIVWVLSCVGINVSVGVGIGDQSQYKSPPLLRLLLQTSPDQQYSSTRTMISTTSQAKTNSEESFSVLEMDIMSLCLVGIGLLMILIVVTSRMLQMGNCCWKGSDMFDTSAAGRYITSVIDFWTDVLFAFRLSSEAHGSTTSVGNFQIENLYLFSMVFVVVPLISSMIFVIYWIYKWRAKTVSVSHRITNYLAKYSPFLVLLSVLGSFHSAMELVRSKLFALNIFNFPLKQKEYNRLWIWRFANQTLLQVCFSSFFFFD